MSNPSYGAKKSEIILFRLNSLREILINLDPGDLAELDRRTADFVVDWTPDDSIPIFMLDSIIESVRSMSLEREAF